LKTLLLALLGAAAMLSASPASAQAYPSRPIRVIVPLAVGSTAEILVRIIGTEFAASTGQPLTVDTIPAAGGTVAMAELAHATPDGYTIGCGTEGSIVFNTTLYAKPGYGAKDFAPIALIGGVSNILVVPPGSPYQSLQDLIARAKAGPAPLTFSSGGSGTSQHLSSVLFGQLTGSSLTHHAYGGSPAGIKAVMTAEVDLGFYNTPTVIQQIRDGTLRALAVTSRKRSPLLPQLPTLDESGVPGYEMDTWFGFVAPAGTPPAVVQKLHDEFARVLALPAIREKLAAQGFDVAPPESSAAFARVIDASLAKWPPIIKASGAKVD
jgi:tripartite-type tricarboxylate transporter receptor subunit TctC